MMRILICFLFLAGSLTSSAQVKSILLDNKDQIVTDTAMAVAQAVFGKIEGDTVYSFKKFDLDGVLLTSGSFKDDSLHIPHGKFVYYDWVNAGDMYAAENYLIDGKERYIMVSGSFNNGLRFGKWLSFYQNGTVKEVALYAAGTLNGVYQRYTTAGKVDVSGTYISGKKTGTWILRGGKREDEYVDDKLISSLTGKKLREKQAQSKNPG